MSSSQNIDNLIEDPAANVLGSTPVSGVGESVPLSRTSDSLHEEVRYTKRLLPHFEKPWAIYAVAISTRHRRKLWPDARTIVLNAILHFHRSRYELFAACVMPDHVHILFQPWPKENDSDREIFWSISEIGHSIKSFTAHKINGLEGTNGALWEEEVFDRYIRSERDLQEKFQYICQNPWDAGIVSPSEDYRWLWTWQDDRGSGSAPVSPEHFSKSSRKRDPSAHARDGRAPRSAAARVESEEERR